jgi:hypothetical protein
VSSFSSGCDGGTAQSDGICSADTRIARSFEEYRARASALQWAAVAVLKSHHGAPFQADADSDVTDRSHHWIRAFCHQIIRGLECSGGSRLECRFLGRKWLFLALVGAR